jgi:hypothetical protein
MEPGGVGQEDRLEIWAIVTGQIVHDDRDAAG